MYHLPPLPYSFDALEPHLDAKTLEIHHGKHHQAYVAGLNKALETAHYAAPENIETLIADLDKLPENIRADVRFHGGGHANHSFFWTSMTPNGGEPCGALADAIVQAFGSTQAMVDAFNAAGNAHRGSGWVWLYLKDNGPLAIATTAYHDTPWMRGQVTCTGTPILVADLWEHAYYLKFQNRRAEFLTSFWKVTNWTTAAQRYADARKA